MSDDSKNEREDVFITYIHATNVVSSLHGMLAAFYVAVEIDGKTTRTSNKPVLVGKDAVEWDEEILLPSERASGISFQLYASCELGPRLGKGELLGQLEITVLDHNEQPQPIGFLVYTDNKDLSSRSSLRIMTERRIYDVNELATSRDLSGSDVTSQLAQLTDTGHRSLLRHHQLRNERDLNEAIACFERVRDMCPPDYPNRSTVLFNLATAKFIHCQVYNAYRDLDLPIRLYRDALQLRNSSHPDHCRTAVELSYALLARFHRRGGKADRTEAKDLFSRVMELSAESYGCRAAYIALEMVEVSMKIQKMGSGISPTDSADPDDEKLIRWARAVLVGLPDWDPRRPLLLARFGGTLQCRFYNNGDLVNLHEAVLMLETVVQLTPDGHPNKPWILRLLANSLLIRFTCVGDLVDINKSISTLGEAVRLTPNGHHNKLNWLCDLAFTLSRRFHHLGDLTDIDKSISLLEEAVHLTSNGNPNKPNLLVNLGISLSRRFNLVGDLADINKSILKFEEAIRLTPNDHPSKPVTLNNLAASLFRRSSHLDDLTDINQSILKFEEAVRLTPNDHPGKPVTLNNLGASLFRRSAHLGDLTDINKSISMLEEAVRLTPNDHPCRPSHLSNLGQLFSSRFDHLGDFADINKSISMLEEVVHLTPNGHPHTPSHLNKLAGLLAHRFDRLGDLADINKSISLLEEAVHLIPSGHPDGPGHLNDLGISLSRRFDHLGDIADINKSISLHEEAVHLTSNGHPDKSARLSNLGNSLSRRFNHVGDLADINKSISMLEEAVRLIPNGHPNRPGHLNSLGMSLSCRFGDLGDLADIDKSISLLEDAVNLTSNDHPNRPALLGNLGNSLSLRFCRLGDITDINRSILKFEEAAHLVPNGHPNRPAHLTALGSLLSRRFDHLGDLADTDKSISLLEEAVNVTSDGHPDKPARLGDLGISLSRRFNYVGDLADINKSISMLEEVVRLTPNGHPRRPGHLNNLGKSLSHRFDHLGDLPDIHKSISLLEEAVHLISNGYPEKPHWLNNLGNVFMRYFEHTRNPSCLSAATLHFSVAARTSAGSTAVRFHAARSWISSLHLEGNCQALLDAYTVIIHLLPELAWLGFPLTDRHRALLNTGDVARDAAAAALDAGCPEMAVEWLEQGRSIVWSQFLQLRTPVDELLVVHPALADRFQQVSQELEHASSRESGSSYWLANDLGADPLALEKEVQRHHRLALTREKLLLEIRSLPGFNRFLLPKTIEQLAASAYSGPVIYLNASKQRCDALIVKAELGNVIPVPLPGIVYPELVQLYSLLRLLLKRDCLIISRDDISALIPSEENFVPKHFLDMLMGDGVKRSDRATKVKPQRMEAYTPDDLFLRILAYLWNTVVHPILEALGFSVGHLRLKVDAFRLKFACSETLQSGVEKMTRIFWCPTGPFAFLPIHAAGLYSTAEAGAKLSDFAISSYIPALSALAPSAQKGFNVPSSNIHLVSVPQPPTDGLKWLALVEEEINHIRTLTTSSPFVTLQDSDGTIEDVVEKMKHADWVHFACHGMQDPEDPLDSGLCLADGRRLKLSDIIRLSCPRGGLAFLSACQTAQGDEQLPEESVHLAAGMLLAGYGGAIGTMWAIRDPDAPRVTKAVYEHLFRDGKVPDSTEAAEALHYAVQRLRDSGVPFSSWVPFIHVGR